MNKYEIYKKPAITLTDDPVEISKNIHKRMPEARILSVENEKTFDSILYDKFSFRYGRAIMEVPGADLRAQKLEIVYIMSPIEIVYNDTKVLTLQFLVFLPAAIIDMNVYQLKNILYKEINLWTLYYMIFIFSQMFISSLFNTFLANRLTAPITHLKK